METTLLRELKRIQQLSVGELQAEWSRLYDGETCRSKNRTYLMKRLCWRIQELAHGGLDARAHARLADLAGDGFRRARTPAEATPAAERPVPGPKRDPQMPVPGTVITREYKGQQLQLVVREDGFELDGRMFHRCRKPPGKSPDRSGTAGCSGA